MSTANMVSLSYRSEKREGKKIGRHVLHVGVIEKLPAEEIKEPDVLLPKVETPTKKVDNYQYRLLKRE